ESQFWEAQRPTLEKAMSTGRYPVMAALSEDTFGPDFDHFGFGLRRILDGLEVHVARRAETASPDAAPRTTARPCRARRQPRRRRPRANSSAQITATAAPPIMTPSSSPSPPAPPSPARAPSPSPVAPSAPFAPGASRAS